MKRGRSVWDIIAWIVLAGILLWLVLKVLGVINTPILLEYAPYFGAVYIVGWQIHKLSVVADDVKELKTFREETIKQIHLIKESCARNHK